jgi:hypothetical protein
VYTHGRPDRAWATAGEFVGGVENSGGGFFLYARSVPLPTMSDLVGELDANGFAEVLQVPAHSQCQYRTLQEVASSKRQHPRFLMLQKGKKAQDRVTDEELLALLIYTGSAAQGDIRKCLREFDQFRGGDFPRKFKWNFTTRLITSAVRKLNEPPPPQLYHGLNGVVGTEQTFVSYNNLVSTSMSLSMARIFALGEGGTVSPSSQSSIGLVLHLDTATFGTLLEEKSFVVADMRWLSKFPDEEEWLWVPHHTGGHAFWDLERPQAEAGSRLMHIKVVARVHLP